MGRIMGRWSSPSRSMSSVAFGWWIANGITSPSRQPEDAREPSEKLNLIERARDFDYLFPVTTIWMRGK